MSHPRHSITPVPQPQPQHHPPSSSHYQTTTARAMATPHLPQSTSTSRLPPTIHHQPHPHPQQQAPRPYPPRPSHSHSQPSYPHPSSRPMAPPSSSTKPRPQSQQVPRHLMPPPSPKTVYPRASPGSDGDGSSISSRTSGPSSLSDHDELERLPSHGGTRMQQSGQVGREPNGRSNTAETWDERIKTPKEMWTMDPAVQGRDDVEAQFDNLLESLQIPVSVREKFSTVAKDVKSSILSSNTMNPSILSSLTSSTSGGPSSSPQIKKRLSTPLLRKAKSSSSIGSPGTSPQVGKTYRVEGDNFTIVASPNPMSPRPAFAASHSHSHSVDTRATGRRERGSSTRPSSFFGGSSTPATPTKRGLGISMPEGPEAMVKWLESYKGTDLAMDVGRAKKLRMLLRHESTPWVSAFLDLGGYARILDRLQDLLEIEWREEQHDDQMLFELLRCVKALSTSDVGKIALQAAHPRPYAALSSLLFSEKKPGDLPCRQLIIELWLILFDLFPTSPLSLPPNSNPSSSVRFQQPPSIPLFVRGLLVPDSDDPTKEHHEFITQAYRPRVFRAWVQELSDICRDYFWIMCHGSNTLWALDEVDEALVEKPVAPGGATGGVEFEAMTYVTTHFKLLNTLSKRLAEEDMDAAKKMHQDLLMSGMDRILVTMRKASTTYYPTLHLEIARYIRFLQLASPAAKLPYLIDKLVGPPPEGMRKRGRQPSYLPPMPISVDGGRRGGWDMQL